jgi:prefoldin subunit 5
MTEIDPREFGRLEAEVKNLTKSIEEISADLKAVRSALDAAGGGWRVLVAVGGLSGAVTAALIKWLPMLPLK